MVHWKLSVSLIFSVPDIYQRNTIIQNNWKTQKHVIVYAFNDEVSMTNIVRMNPIAGKLKQRHRETTWLVQACHHHHC